MFEDLLDKSIQPERIDVWHLPDISISSDLGKQLEDALKKEENSFVRISDKTSIVQTDKNYVFFSNQWLYLAVLCKRYAEQLKTYCDFFDQSVREIRVKNEQYS